MVDGGSRLGWLVRSCPCRGPCPSPCSELATLWPEVLRDEVTGVASSLSRKKEHLSSRGESGENDGNEVRDLSEAAMDDAELEGCDVSFLRVRAADRWLLIEVADCCETERSRGAEEAAVVASMLSVRMSHRPGPSLLAGCCSNSSSSSSSRSHSRLDYRVNPPLSM